MFWAAFPRLDGRFVGLEVVSRLNEFDRVTAWRQVVLAVRVGVVTSQKPYF